MANISCKCGFIFSDNQSPCPSQFNLIADVDGETLTQNILDVVAAADDVWPKVDYLISTSGSITYICPSCQGLLVFWEGLSKVATYYKKES